MSAAGAARRVVEARSSARGASSGGAAAAFGRVSPGAVAERAGASGAFAGWVSVGAVTPTPVAPATGAVVETAVSATGSARVSGVTAFVTVSASAPTARPTGALSVEEGESIVLVRDVAVAFAASATGATAAVTGDVVVDTAADKAWNAVASVDEGAVEPRSPSARAEGANAADMAAAAVAAKARRFIPLRR